MRRNRIGIFDPLWVGGSTALAIALMASVGWSQVPVPVPAVPEAVQDATNAAQDAVKDATNTAKDVQNDAKDAAQDAAKDVKDIAKDVQKDAKDTAQDAAKDVKDTAKDVQKDTKATTQDAVKDAKNATRDAESAARETVKDAKNATRDAESAARETVKDAKNATRDAESTARDAAKDAKDTVNDATKAARDVTRDVRDTVKDATDTAREAIDARANARTERSVRTQANANNNFRAADLGVWFDRSTRNGLTIADVAANTALAQVGFRTGDRIVSVGGRNITTETDFIRYLTNNNARGRMNVIVLRDGQQQTLYIDPTVISQQTTTTTVDPLEQFGIILDDRYADRLLVWRVIPRSPAFYAGIRAGDVLTSFGNQRLSDPKAFVQIVQRTNAGLVPIQISRNGQMRVIEADFPDLQVSGPHTTFRQNLDTGVNVRSNIDTGVDAAPLPDRGGYYNDYRSNPPPARGIFRRRR